jgi:hypothetical protein
MKVGDLVDIPTGRGSERCQGILIDIRDNPSDVEYNFHNGGKIRRIIDVMSGGKIFCSFQASAKVINESR